MVVIYSFSHNKSVMETAVFNIEFNKIFKRFESESMPGVLYVEPAFYKNLRNFFLAGDSYYFIINHHNQEVEMMSNEVEDIMGYTPVEYNISFMNEKLHPEDHPWFLTFGNKILEFFSELPLEKVMKYKVRYDIRLKKKNGNYARILYQGMLLEHDANGRFLRSLGLHSDITYLKHEGKPTLSFIGMDGEPSYYDVGAENIFIENEEDLSKREKQILALIIEGKPSKEIGNVLNISKQTVDTHRKNMIHKKKLSNTGELIGKAIRCGWI
jgi:DNA-binding CsgD family transcriptional regulator